MFIAFSCFCLSGASIAREINVSRSSGDSSGSLPGVGWIRAGAHWWAGGINFSRLCMVFAEWEPSAQRGSLLLSALWSWQVLKPAE